MTPGVFSTIQKQSCCLSKNDRRFNDGKSLNFHIQYEKKSIKSSIIKDIQFERTCLCGKLQPQCLILPKLLIIQTQKKTDISSENEIIIGSIRYKLISIIWFNAIDGQHWRNHFYIWFMVR